MPARSMPGTMGNLRTTAPSSRTQHQAGDTIARLDGLAAQEVLFGCQVAHMQPLELVDHLLLLFELHGLTSSAWVAELP